jgi:FMN reductase
MSSIVTIAGSPSHPSRSAALLDYARRYAEERSISTNAIIVRNLNAEELIQGQFNGASIQQSVQMIASADGVIIATPIYKASYTGVLKSLLDVLPPAVFAGKTVLPIAMGGSMAHMLVLDYALKPVLVALGAQHVLNGIYLVDNQMEYTSDSFRFTDADAEQRMNNALDTLIAGIQK